MTDIMNHALGVVGRRQFEDEAITRVRPEEVAISNKYNLRAEFTPCTDERYAADFLIRLSNMEYKRQKRIIEIGFISLEGADLNIFGAYEMEDGGMLNMPGSHKNVAYLLGANRPVDDFLNSIFDSADAKTGQFVEHRQLQLA